MFYSPTGSVYFNAKRKISNLKNKLINIKPANKAVVTKLDPAKIPKYVNQLVKPPEYKATVVKELDKKDKKHPVKIKHYYRIDISEFKEQILPQGFPQTKVWGYGGLVVDPETGKTKYSRSAPGATFEVIRGIPITVKWINRLKNEHLFAVDPTLHWANPNNMPMDPTMPWPKFPQGFPKAQAPVPIVTHLHGGETPSEFDGHPDAWFTYDNKRGAVYKTATYTYPNQQQPTTLWYHDHALGITRLNVYAGLAGFYLLREGEHEKNYSCYPESKLKLPCGKYEIPIVIQDRMFNTDGTLLFNNVGNNPDIHPYWVPEFFGDTIMVNGKVWPNLNVGRRQYRFRLLNGSNARFYNMTFSNKMKFIQIGSDGGFLPKPVELNSLLLAPGERADILVDFSKITPGTSIRLLNDAKAPFPDGDDPDPNTVGQIMQFTIPSGAIKTKEPSKLPNTLNCIPDLKPDAPNRILTLNEVMGPNGPTAVLLNNQMWSDPITELPRVGSTEDWWIVNQTMDTHPIHLHLVQFLLIDRQNFNSDALKIKMDEMKSPTNDPTNDPIKPISIQSFLLDTPMEPDENERGWKDTIRMNPNQVTRIRVRFAPQDVPVNLAKPGVNFYPFNPKCGPGYVWHCHILDHEDNEMMRPYKVKP